MHSTPPALRGAGATFLATGLPITPKPPTVLDADVEFSRWSGSGVGAGFLSPPKPEPSPAKMVTQK